MSSAIPSLRSLEEWERLWARLGEPAPFCVLVFKRSPICPISHAAEDEFARYVAGQPEGKGLQLTFVDVINDRPVSQRIAQDTQVRHASPQALLLAQGRRILWQESHGGINADSLESAFGFLDGELAGKS